MTAGQRDKSAEQRRREDLELVHSAAAGDANARRWLVERLLVRVRGTAYGLASGHPDFEDHAQASMIEILQSLPTYRGDAVLEKWAERITVRTTLRLLRQRRGGEVPVELERLPFASDQPGAEEELARQRVARRVAVLLAGLKPKHRIALNLRLALGYSVAEIAEITETPFNTVRNRLRRGRKLLQGRIARDPVLSEWLGSEEG